MGNQKEFIISGFEKGLNDQFEQVGKEFLKTETYEVHRDYGLDIVDSKRVTGEELLELLYDYFVSCEDDSYQGDSIMFEPGDSEDWGLDFDPIAVITLRDDEVIFVKEV